MRSFENGTLKMDGDSVYGMPPHNLMRVPMVNAPAPHLLTKLNPERMYLLGDPRTNQNPGFLVLGIIFYRWHNYQVSQGAANYSIDIFRLESRARLIWTDKHAAIYWMSNKSWPFFCD